MELLVFDGLDWSSAAIEVLVENCASTIRHKLNRFRVVCGPGS
jgi:hypothetical protein